MRWALVTPIFTIAACSLFTDLGGLSGTAPDEAGSPVGADASEGGRLEDADAKDASLEVGVGGHESCPNVGDVCVDETIFIGISPDGNVPMFLSTLTRSSSTLVWGSQGTTRGTTSSQTGAANTSVLGAFGAGAHPAANHCHTATALGFTDWYLPAADELAVVHQARGVFASSMQWTWSSTEVDSSRAIEIDFRTDDGRGPGPKQDSADDVICVRKR